jgi:hypothetical protein
MHGQGDGWLGWSLRLDVSDAHVLDKCDAEDLLDHQHNLRGISTVPERTHRDIDNFTQDIIKQTKWPLLQIKQDQVALILRTSGGISNARSQGGSKVAVEGVALC